MVNDKTCLAKAREHFDQRYYDETNAKIAYCWSYISLIIKDAFGVKHLSDMDNTQRQKANELAIRITDMVFDQYCGVEPKPSTLELENSVLRSIIRREYEEPNYISDAVDTIGCNKCPKRIAGRCPVIESNECLLSDDDLLEIFFKFELKKEETKCH